MFVSHSGKIFDFRDYPEFTSYPSLKNHGIAFWDSGLLKGLVMSVINDKSNDIRSPNLAMNHLICRGRLIYENFFHKQLTFYEQEIKSSKQKEMKLFGNLTNKEKLIVEDYDDADIAIRQSIFATWTNEKRSSIDEYLLQRSHVIRYKSFSKELKKALEESSLVNNVNYLNFNNNKDYYQIDEITINAIHCVIEVALIDDFLHSFIDKERNDIFRKYHHLITFKQLNSVLREVRYPNSGLTNHSETLSAIRKQEKSNVRFKLARTFSRGQATKLWKKDPTARYGQVALNIQMSIKQNIQDFGLAKSPNLETIKKWIKELAPNSECLKSGRPKF